MGDPTNPYDSVATAAYALTHATDELSHAVKSFNILKQTNRTPVVVVTPETGRLPSAGMGQFAKYVSGKSGGLGEVISALCKGLSERNIPVHLITLNLSRRFREEAGMSEAEWIQTRHRLNPENVHLVSSAIFEGYRSAYDGSPPANAAEFQRQIVNTYHQRDSQCLRRPGHPPYQRLDGRRRHHALCQAARRARSCTPSTTPTRGTCRWTCTTA